MNSNNENRKKIVYIHHAAGIGGAPLDLLFLLQKADNSLFQTKVLFLHDSDVVKIFKDHNINVRILEGWRPFSHTEVYWIKWKKPHLLLSACCSWFVTALFYGKKILREEKPDMVYLNSTP